MKQKPQYVKQTSSKLRTTVRVHTVERTNPDRPTLEYPSNIKRVLYKVSI